jgi:hypothetical protein
MHYTVICIRGFYCCKAGRDAATGENACCLPTEPLARANRYQRTRQRAAARAYLLTRRFASGIEKIAGKDVLENLNTEVRRL